jgi:TctA family transporter
MHQRTLEGNGDIDGPSRVDIADSADAVATVATVAVVGIGAAVFEAALLPGIALGVAAMWLPRYYAKMGEALEPLFESTVSGVNAANAAVNVFNLASRAGRLGLRVGRRRRLFAGPRLSFWPR